jgi:hypothetical protein
MFATIAAIDCAAELVGGVVTPSLLGVDARGQQKSSLFLVSSVSQHLE